VRAYDESGTEFPFHLRRTPWVKFVSCATVLTPSPGSAD
jgi:hypothetical protein